jgi:sodium transport system permease protein
MWLNQTLAVLSKETRDGLRDRRAFSSGLIYALVGPMLVTFMLGSLARSQSADKPLEVALAGREHAPSLIQYLEQEGVVLVPAPVDAEAAVRRGDLDLVLRIGGDYPTAWRDLRSAPLELLHDSARNESRAALGRLQQTLERYRDQVAGLRLLARGIDREIVKPLDIRRLDFATPLAKAARILGSFPIFFLLAAFIGGMNIAIDTTAGERERGSLEALLSHAAPTSALAFGKWGAAVAFNVLSVVLTLAVTVLLFRSGRFEGLNVPIRFGIEEALPTLAVLLPLALMVPALQMVMAIYSRNFKEAQTYLSLLMFLPMLPGFLLAFDALQVEGWMHRVPVLAQQVQLVDLFSGKTIGAGQFFGGALATLAVGLVLVWMLGALLRREKIVLAR